MVGEEGAFVLGWDEVLTEEELSVTLKVSNARWLPGGQEHHGHCSCLNTMRNGEMKADKHGKGFWS